MVTFKKILPWIMLAILAAVAFHFWKQAMKPAAKTPKNTGIVPPGVFEYAQGDLNLDGIIDNADF